MYLTLENVLVRKNERGANLDFLGGSLWLRPDIASQLPEGSCKRVVLNVSLRSVRSESGSHTAIYPVSIRSRD